MTDDEIVELVSKGKTDGARLYRVADALYKILVGFNWLFGVLGTVIALALLGEGNLGSSLAVLLLTLLICALGYAAAVLGSHGAKALVHILFSNLAILERTQK